LLANYLKLVTTNFAVHKHTHLFGRDAHACTDGGMGVRTWGQLTPREMDEKLKSGNMQKRTVFYVYVIFREQSGQAGVENGAMLTTYLFRYTSECTIS